MEKSSCPQVIFSMRKTKEYEWLNGRPSFVYNIYFYTSMYKLGFIWEGQSIRVHVFHSRNNDCHEEINELK